MASICEQICTALQARVVGPVYRFGELEAPRHGTLPRVVWVPAPDEDFGPPAQKGGTQRQLRTRILRVTAHVLGATVEATEVLVHALVAAAHREAGPMVRFLSGRWVNQEEREAAHGLQGQLYLLVLEFSVPIYDTAATTIVVEQVDLAGGTPAAGDGALEHGEDESPPPPPDP